MAVFTTISYRGVSGYSGVDPIDLEEESFSQPTFTPAYDKWHVFDDLSVVSNTLVYTKSETESGGQFYQSIEDLAIPMVPSGLYILKLTVEDLIGTHFTLSVWCNYPYFENTPLTSGVNNYNFIHTNEDGSPLSIVVYASEMGESLKITSVSLKLYGAAPRGISGYSGEITTFPNKCSYMEPSGEDLIENFNILLSNLQSSGWMQEESLS